VAAICLLSLPATRSGITSHSRGVSASSRYREGKLQAVNQQCAIHRFITTPELSASTSRGRTSPGIADFRPRIPAASAILAKSGLCRAVAKSKMPAAFISSSTTKELFRMGFLEIPTADFEARDMRSDREDRHPAAVEDEPSNALMQLLTAYQRFPVLVSACLSEYPWSLLLTRTLRASCPLLLCRWPGSRSRVAL
jgi:hypothetical protein